MPDREKVIKGLECLTNEDPYMSTIACAEKKCPYAVIPDCNLAIWHDALELLKEQEIVVRCKDCKHRLECDYCIENGDDWFCADGERR